MASAGYGLSGRSPLVAVIHRLCDIFANLVAFRAARQITLSKGEDFDPGQG
jgi:hypothetical protein